MSSQGSFLLLDCTVRDGGYINEWDFPIPMVQEMYRASSAAGSDIFEVGFLGEDEKRPLWRRSPPWAIREVRGDGKTRISAMLEADTVGMKLPNPRESGIDVLRVALNQDKVVQSLPKMADYRKQGYQVFVQLMGITAYRDDEILRMIQAIETSGTADYINIGDSYGSLLPDRTRHILSLMKAHTRLKVGIHPHNNIQMGMANILAALEAGADVVDGSMYGMGRGGGNVPLELIISYFGRQMPDRFDALPVLDFIDRYMLKLTQRYSWGYSLHSLLSGIYECHPYYTGKLVERREYTIEQVLKTVRIVGGSDVIGFSDQLLTSIIESGFAKDREELEINVRQFIAEHRERVPYQGRHRGREFLIMGGGPSLVRYRNEIEDYIGRHSPIVMGANNLDGMFTPHYHAFNNQRRFQQFAPMVSGESRLILGPGIKTDLPASSYEKIVCYNSSATDLRITGGVITSNGRSIAVLMAAVALVMGAESLAFVGMDGYLGEGSPLFYAEEESKHPTDLLEKQNANQHYLEQLARCAQSMNCARLRFLTPTTYRLGSPYELNIFEHT